MLVSAVSTIKGSIKLAHIVYVAMDSQPTPIFTLTICHCKSSFRQSMKPETTEGSNSHSAEVQTRTMFVRSVNKKDAQVSP